MSNTPTRIRFHAFSAQKEGLDPAEWEDACAISRRSLRFAISDGASASFAAQAWARCLVDTWIAEPKGSLAARACSRVIERAASEWEVARSTVTRGTVPGYLADARKGKERLAYATFVGGQFLRGGKSFVLQTVSYGDSALFLIRNEDLVAAAPSNILEIEFDERPELLVSRPGQTPDLRFDEFLLRQGDMVVAATDALAEMLRDGHNAGNQVWKHVQGLDPQSFAGWIDEQRTSGDLHNDDVTLLRIQL